MYRILSALAIALTFLAPTAAFAASITLAPMSVSVTPGKVFTVTVTANPQNQDMYTFRANLSFDPSLVQVTNFTFAPKWLPLSTSGYDVTDNTKGSLIKTAGYPGGLTAPTVFGTVTFTAKASGTAHITVTNQSLALDANSKNALSGTQGATTVTVAAPVVQKVTPKQVVTKTLPKPVTTTVKAATKPAPTATTTATTTAVLATTTTATSTATTTFGAAAANASSGGTNKVLWIAIIAIAAILGGLFWANKRRSNKMPKI